MMTAAAMSSSFFTKAPSSFSCHRTPFLHSPPQFPIGSHFKKGVWGEKFELLKVSCKSEKCEGSFRSEAEKTTSSSTSSLQSSSSSSIINGEDDRSISAYRLCAAFGDIGFLETAYLTYLKITNSEKNFGLDKIKKMFGSQFITSLVIIALITSYIVVSPVPSSLAEEMPYVETEITKESSPLALSLARHLQSVGAKLYGAFWCSHCVHQKQMFGHDAAKLLDYIECYPDGVREGAKMAKACTDANLNGFPSWEINGQFFTGTKQFPELAKLSGIKLEDLSREN